MFDPRYLTLLFTAVAVLGSIWAMKRRRSEAFVKVFALLGLVGLSAFALLSR
jgi:hypothetical protein